MIALLIYVLIVIMIFGAILWAVNTYVAVPQPLKNILMLIIVLIMILVLLNLLGILGTPPFRLNAPL
jgi:hypothetical protein